MNGALIIKRGSECAGEMEYSAWAPWYERIRSDFGFAMDREERAAARLDALLPEADRVDGLARATRPLRDHEVIVVGLAPRAGPPPIWRLPSPSSPPVVVAADGAAAVCLDAGIVPAVIVTDLDGPVAAEVTANRRGSLVVVHAHGDNGPAIERWVPEFPGALVGSWAGPPSPSLINVGGFTDGDRAVCLAEHARARRVTLWGFDFGTVEEATAPESVEKRRKLAWAERIVAELTRTGPAPIQSWRRDGSIVPYGGGISEASTR
jgi:2-amino-4-hydroxy-6-hydroxymethyldihydropteridine diphosphokinase